MTQRVESPKADSTAVKYRQIFKATTGHGYRAVYYTDELDVVREETITINATNRRLKDKHGAWEERVEGAPGWWVCDDPTKAVGDDFEEDSDC